MISEETLLLYFYQDGLSDSERARVRDSLAHDDALCKRYRLLTEELRQLQCDAAAPSASVTDAWHSALDREIQREAITNGKAPGWRIFLTGLRPALIAIVPIVFAAGWLLGTYRSGDGTENVPLVAEAPVKPPSLEAAAPAAFVRGVSRHFEHTQIQLASLASVSRGHDRSALVDQMVAQNRYYLRIAKAQGAHDIARLLRAFEPLLRDLAAQTPNDGSAVKSREQLQFELNVTLTKLEQRASNNVNEF